MRFAIRHETLYRYSAPLTYTIQQLRMTPRNELHQRILAWKIFTPGNRHSFLDGYGNACQMLTLRNRHADLRIVAEGMVDIDALDRGRLMTRDTLSPLVFSVSTVLTAPSAAIAAFASAHLYDLGSEAMLRLATAVCGAVTYQTGATDVKSCADDALLLGQGVCQDHAHLFIACCHAHGIPARYVSGYIDPGGSNHAETHAWVDVWVHDIDYRGWVSIDVTHARFADASLCRLAVGRDYTSAAPVRGMRRGGGKESLHASVALQQLG